MPAHTMQIPREIPPSKFKVSVRAYTGDDDDLAELDFTFDFASLPPR
ncbi:hypothetical protein ACH4A8_11585 [Streptomyces vietnamensis]